MFCPSTNTKKTIFNFDSAYSSRVLASSNGKLLWLESRVSESIGYHANMEFTLLRLSDSTIIPIKTGRSFFGKATTYYLASNSNCLFVLPDSGSLLRISDSGITSSLPLLTVIPGERTATGMASDTTFWVVQEIANLRYLILFSQLGERLSSPVKLLGGYDCPVLYRNGKMLCISKVNDSLCLRNLSIP